MTPKERLLAAIKGEPIDRVPFSPFLAYYFETLDAKTQEKGMLDYLEKMNADPLLRGFYAPWSGVYKNCTISENIIGKKKTIIRQTPKGDLTEEYTYVLDANTWFLTKHPVETKDDLSKLIYCFEDLQINPEIEGFNAILKDIGERALVLNTVGTNAKSAFQSLLEHWIGTENLIYMCYDYPDEIEQVLDVMKRKSLKTIEYTAESESEACISWEDSSTTNISPAMYEKYIAPEITEWVNILKQSDTLYIQHACGHLKDLLLPISKQGVAAIESVSPPPTGNITIEEALDIVPNNVALIGGIEATFILNCSMKELEEYVEHVLTLNKGRKYILANSDSCPPGVDYKKFTRIAELVRQIKI